MEPASYRLWPVFTPRAQREHVKNCDACQSERQKYSIKHRAWSIITQARRRAQAPADVSALERGESKLHTPVGDRLTLPPTHGARPLEKDGAKVHVATISIGGMTCASWAHLQVPWAIRWHSSPVVLVDGHSALTPF